MLERQKNWQITTLNSLNPVQSKPTTSVLIAIPGFLGEKIVYKRINPDVRTTLIRDAFDLLRKARVCHRVTSCYANGVPLAAELNKNFYKAIFLDVGLCSAVLKLKFDQITTIDDINLINNGGLAEQVVGQLLRTLDLPYVEPELYYWVRNEGGSSSEIDYLIQQGSRIVPIEVKAGSTGTLKSLHLFMRLKKLSMALRINSDCPSQTNVEMKDSMGNKVRYTLLSIPFYLLGQIHRLI